MAQTLELLVRDVVRDVVDRVERRVEALLVAELEAELARRRKGGADPRDDRSNRQEDPVAEVSDEPTSTTAEPLADPSSEVSAPEPSTSPSRCRVCGETKPLDAFARDKSKPSGYRNECRECRRRADRQRRAGSRSAAGDDEEPHRASGNRRRSSYRPPNVRMGTMGRLVGGGARVVAEVEERRRLLAELRANGVSYEERDGRTFRVLRLPSVESEVVSLAPRVEPRRVRASPVA